MSGPCRLPLARAENAKDAAGRRASVRAASKRPTREGGRIGAGLQAVPKGQHEAADACANINS
jgi:hypothetical protein